jgi:hypothetical protein
MNADGAENCSGLDTPLRYITIFVELRNGGMTKS